MASKKIQIVGLEIPQSDFHQTDETQLDFIKNKPTLGSLSSKNEVAKSDLAVDVQASLNRADNSANAVDLTEHKNDTGNPHKVKLAQLGVTATADELNYVDGVISNVQAQLDTKANKVDIATTVMQGTAVQNNTYWKISNFGNWGTGTWMQKGFSMLITSRAGEMVWLSLAANDSNTSAGAIRLINRYAKIVSLHYSVSESAIYVLAAGWANNICAHIISNVNGDYVPTITSADILPSDAVDVNIVEFGINSTGAVVGDSSVLLEMGGSADRPTYNGNDMALVRDVPTKPSDIGAAASSHNQAAETITGGIFAGQVVAKSDAQTPGTSLLRNSKLVSTETNPTVSGEICWRYG